MIHDPKEVATALKSAGFEVTESSNAYKGSLKLEYWCDMVRNR